MVAVEADPTNLAYVKESLHINKIGGRTRLLHNAIRFFPKKHCINPNSVISKKPYFRLPPSRKTPELRR